MSFTPESVAFLAAHQEQITAVAAELDLRPQAAIATATALDKHFGPESRAVHELVKARAGARGKLPAHWLMCTDSSQQATPLAVAALRAQHLRRVMPEAVVHDVTCSIGTDAAAVRAAGGTVIASDLDPARATMAAYNLAHLTADVDGGSEGSGWMVARADALQPTSTADIIVADPARRAGGRRISRPEDLIPPLPTLMETYSGRELAVKCAPGLNFDSFDGLVSISSVDGKVKEACLFTPGLAEGLRREAHVVRTTDQGPHVETFTDADSDDCPVTEPRTYLIDPDGAVVRAGLVRHFAARYQLSQLDERIAYLTGDAIPAGYSGFEILEVTSPKKVKAAVKAHGLGRLEILLRGIDGDPDALRKSYKPSGPNSGAVVLTRIGRSGVALICGPRQHEPGPRRAGQLLPRWAAVD